MSVWVLKGRAKENLLLARSSHSILKLLKELGLPHKEYVYGDSAIAFEFGVEKEGWRGNFKRQKLSGEVQCIVDLALALFESETGGDFKIYKSPEPGMSVELSLRYALQEFMRNVSNEKIEAFKRKLKEKLQNIMTIEAEKDRWTPLPRPQQVPFETVFD